MPIGNEGLSKTPEPGTGGNSRSSYTGLETCGEQLTGCSGH